MLFYKSYSFSHFKDCIFYHSIWQTDEKSPMSHCASTTWLTPLMYPYCNYTTGALTKTFCCVGYMGYTPNHHWQDLFYGEIELWGSTKTGAGLALPSAMGSRCRLSLVPEKDYTEGRWCGCNHTSIKSHFRCQAIPWLQSIMQSIANCRLYSLYLLLKYLFY